MPNTITEVYAGGSSETTFPMPVTTSGKIDFGLTIGNGLIVVGANTSFLSEYKQGDWMPFLKGGSSGIIMVREVLSDTELRLFSPVPFDNSGISPLRIRSRLSKIVLNVRSENLATFPIVRINGKKLLCNVGLLNSCSPSFSFEWSKDADPRSFRKNLLAPILIDMIDAPFTQATVTGTIY